ncbi:MAG: hypothetical protein JWP74_2343 [Marmoricola sp.]|nr:hypothetical protein [Marmoricola sp.]
MRMNTRVVALVLVGALVLLSAATLIGLAVGH